jgi:predicted O-linked N-acetylglucosamine transferase (SPINDLY family)
LAGIDGLVAGDQDDYVGIAARLALDPAWRAARAADIRAAAGRLFDDPEPVRALSAVFEALVHGDAPVTPDATVR